MDAWERIEGESEEAYEAFLYYLHGGVRYSLRNVSEDHFGGSHLRILEKWSSEHGWVRRRGDYLQEIERQRQLKLEETRRECEDYLEKNALNLTKALVSAALATGDPRLLKDALDRVGVIRKKADSGLIRGKFEFNMEALPDNVLQAIIDALSE